MQESVTYLAAIIYKLSEQDYLSSEESKEESLSETLVGASEEESREESTKAPAAGSELLQQIRDAYEHNDVV